MNEHILYSVYQTNKYTFTKKVLMQNGSSWKSIHGSQALLACWSLMQKLARFKIPTVLNRIPTTLSSPDERVTSSAISILIGWYLQPATVRLVVMRTWRKVKWNKGSDWLTAHITLLPSLESSVDWRWRRQHLPLGVMLEGAGRCSCRGYHWATGLRGFSSISYQWSRPRPLYLGPRATLPISSSLPILLNNI